MNGRGQLTADEVFEQMMWAACYTGVQMPHVLVMSSEFAPLPTVGRLRVQRFCRQLLHRGWKVSVLTLEPPEHHQTDPMLLGEIPEGIAIHRVRLPQVLEWPIKVITGLIRRPQRVSGSIDNVITCSNGLPDSPHLSEGQKATSFFLDRLSQWIDGFKHISARHLLIPDDTAPAIGGLVRSGVKLTGDDPVDLILVSVPSFSFWLAAQRIGRRIRRPVVVDYRDLWSGDVLRQWVGALRRGMETRVERRLLAQAAGIITVSRRKTDYIRRLIPNAKAACMTTLYNSSDIPAESTVPPDEPSTPGRLTFVYTGRLYGHRRIDPLLTSVARLLHTSLITAEDLAIELVGAIAEDQAARLQRIIHDHGLEHVVHMTGYVTHTQAVAKQQSADVLVIVVDEGPTSDGVVPAKLAEYFATGRRVAAICGPGEVADLLRSYGWGVQLDPEQAEAFDRHLLSLIMEFKGDPVLFRRRRAPARHPLTDDGGIGIDTFLRGLLAGRTERDISADARQGLSAVLVG